jgi:fructan beta-fructosidase
MRRLFVCLVMVIFLVSSFAQQPAYREKYRPQFHFSPPANWMNDPNGMVYYKGEYHLFYQYYPDSTIWGPMHWGHAVSTDLIHWQNLPVALYPDSLGYIFSGSVVFDENNTTGFQQNDENPLVAIFTYHNARGEKDGRNNFQTQGMAYSIDKGRTWKKYANNPVLKNPGNKDFRDPKVSWHEASGYWVMTLAVGNKIQFYHSKNLKEWELTDEFGTTEGSHGGVWECPDLFPMQTGKEGKTKWVLLVSIGSGAPNGGSGTQYFVGDFDGNTFKNDNNPSTVLWIDYGCDNYAGVTWSNTQNRRIFLGWMSNWQYAQLVPTQPWRSAMTLPRELFLKESGKGLRLYAEPVKESGSLRRKRYEIAGTGKTASYLGLNEIELSFDLQQTTASDMGIECSNSKNEKIKIGFDKTANQFYIDRINAGVSMFAKEFAGKHTAPRVAESRILKLHIFIDRSSVELFADDGSVVMTELFFPSEDYTNIRLYGQNGSNLLNGAHIFELKPSWNF